MSMMTQASSEYFEQVAGRWDQVSSGYFGPAVREAAIARAYLRPEWAVADIGAGTGFMAAGLAPLVAQVHVVDGSPAMLDVARRNLAAFDNVVFHPADGLALPFDDSSLDAVFANMYLHHCPDPQAALREMARVLRPGGRLVITDMEAHEHAWLKDEMADVWQGFARADLRAWLAEAGLVNVIVAATGSSCCAQSAGPTLTGSQGQQARISLLVAAATRRMSMRPAVQAAYTGYSEQGCNCQPQTSGISLLVEQSCCPPAGEHALVTGQPGCCGGAQPEDAGEFVLNYSSAELSLAPEEAAGFSLGCGNPTAMAGIKPGETVLDIGSGGGLDAFIAARRVGAQGRVIGVDMTPAMLARSRASAQRNGFANVEFREGYAEALPVEDGSVDVIISNCVINLSEDKGLVFREAFRALKPGGRLEVSDVVAAGALSFAARADAHHWSECASGALPEGEYLALVTAAGFEQVSVRRSPASGSLDGVALYSAQVSAVKPAAQAEGGCSCGC